VPILVASPWAIPGLEGNPRGAALISTASPRGRPRAAPETASPRTATKEAKAAAKPSAAKARAKKAPAEKTPAEKDSLRIVLASLDDMKAEDTVSIDITGKAAFADQMVVTSGRSNRHVGAVADDVIEKLHKAGFKNLRIEGKKNCDWVLIDAGDVVVHVFRPEVRAFYDIEKMWAGPTRGREAG
jgi:ribosome-associated protein